MIFSRLAATTILLGLFASSVFSATPARSKPTRPAPADAGTYKGAIVIDAVTGSVLFERDADTVNPPASMTKLMTFAVLHDKLQKGTLTLSAPVRITNLDASMGGTGVYLDPRETFSVEELIYAMMIQSANDAAHALARFSAGSREAFVELMNAKAHELGMNHTTFRSPHGLPVRPISDGDLTTPRDFAVLCRYLLLETDVLNYSSVVHRDFAPERAKGAFKMENHNKLLGKVAGVDGLKTGYTLGAGYCISATAQRNGHRVIVVVMGSFGANGRIDEGVSRNIKTIELLERGFAALPPGSPPFVGKMSVVTASPLSVAPPPPPQKLGEPDPNASPVIKFNIPGAKK